MAVLPTPRPGAASTAVRDLLTGPVRDAQVLGVHPACVYVQVNDDVVAVETADGLGLPCAIRLGVDRAAGCFRHVRHGDDAAVGDGLVRAGPVTVRVARWWAPRPPLPPRPAVSAGSTERVARVTDLLAAHPAPVPVDAPVDELLGLGPGLTPAGDDVLAGLLVALHHHPREREAHAPEIRLSARTTTLSAALLRHAAAGRALPAVMDLADALAGHGPTDEVERVVGRLLAVGSSSGVALAHGLLRGARTVAGGARPKEAVA